MPFSLLVWNKSTNASTYTALSNESTDQLFGTGGSTTTYVVPASHTKIIGLYGLGNTLGSGAGLKRYRLNAPSFLKSGLGVYPAVENPDAAGTAGTLAPNDPQAFEDRFFSPISVATNDNLGVDVITDGGTAGQVYVVAVIGSGDQQELDLRGKTVIPVRYTGTTTLNANAWTSVALTADQALAPGTYIIVGMRYVGATAIAARLIIPGYGFRPGCIGTSALNKPDVGAPSRFRNGKLGMWGSFDSTAVPNVECFASAGDTAEDIIFDLMPA